MAEHRHSAGTLMIGRCRVSCHARTYPARQHQPTTLGYEAGQTSATRSESWGVCSRTAGYSAIPMSEKDYSSVDDYLLDYFDNPTVLAQFNLATGSRLSHAQRPAFVRFLADEDEAPPFRAVYMDQMDAERFVAYIEQSVWQPLAEFLGKFTKELENPERFGTLCGQFEAELRRDGLWHANHIDIIRDYIDLLPRP